MLEDSEEARDAEEAMRLQIDEEGRERINSYRMAKRAEAHAAKEAAEDDDDFDDDDYDVDVEYVR